MITEDYVSYETAQLLKSKGFDELCYACYEYFRSGVTMYSGWLFEYKGEPVHNTNDRVKCPTLQMSMKWLREAHNLYINIFVTWKNKIPHYQWSIDNLITQDTIYETPCLEKYEQACEAAILYCLENLI